MQTLSNAAVSVHRNTQGATARQRFCRVRLASAVGCSLIFVTRKPKRPFQRFQCLTQGMDRTTT
jgi:hypothetical protein